MTNKERLLDALFNTEGERHLNLKFYRGFSDDISPEDLCEQANLAIFQAKIGLVEGRPSFGDKGRKAVDVAEVFAH